MGLPSNGHEHTARAERKKKEKKKGLVVFIPVLYSARTVSRQKSEKNQKGEANFGRKTAVLCISQTTRNGAQLKT